jgi:hypothetical protein
LTTKPEEQAWRKQKLVDLVGKLFSEVLGILFGKDGFIRRHGLGRRVDRSARLVITPNPALAWDEVGLPGAVLVELFGDRVLQWLSDSPGHQNSDPTDLLHRWSWLTPRCDPTEFAGLENAVRNFLKERSDTVVLLNRQPTLHRQSIQAFRPVLLPKESGLVMQINPLVCSGFGADFDGDEMTVHAPVGEEAMKEALGFLPTEQLLSPATGRPAAGFSQDFVLGTFELGAAGGPCDRDLTDTFHHDCCRDYFSGGSLTAEQGEELLLHVLMVHREDAARIVPSWMNVAFRRCTESGVSLGYYDLRKLESTFRSRVIDKSRDDQKALPENLIAELRTYIDATGDISQAGYHAAAMAVTGARGRKQIVRLIIGRVPLSPGDTPFDFDPVKEKFAIETSLATGWNKDEAFYAAMNARSSMIDKKLSTRRAGYLMRRLVAALWRWSITVAKCTRIDESDPGISKYPLLCCGAARSPGRRSVRRKDLEHQSHPQGKGTTVPMLGLCAECYGPLPDGSLAPVGYPVGLLAAQSIGERGTQLSMQSFHTGTRAVNMADIETDLSRQNDHFRSVDTIAGFLDKVYAKPAPEGQGRDYGDYRKLLKQHWQVLSLARLNSRKKSPDSTTWSNDTSSHLAFGNARRQLFLAAHATATDEPNEPQSRSQAIATDKSEGPQTGNQAIVPPGSIAGHLLFGCRCPLFERPPSEETEKTEGVV